ncbi:unnamed protein product [Rotaria sordida]|uniref:Uncharacterized protein n=4 Tax=Rotaria sordida TaxID=392033 RepID=A0A819HSV3_9BILA|nr:unnamed protein product [Rotaria sordida]CAF3769555.1 unnamed protein product [Rotaria sordida]CAF3902000.1 unnamed protein product [Rotaria sordida]
MKRTNFTTSTTNEVTSINLEGYVIGVTSIIKNENNANHHYTLTMEGHNGSVITVMRYLSSNVVCRLYAQLRILFDNQHGFELLHLKSNGSSYTITNETRLAEKKLTFEPQWYINQDILSLKSLAEERICAVQCKIIHVNRSESFIVTSGYKRTQKLRKEVIVGDRTGAMVLNIYEIHFNSITTGLSYKISAVKTRLFKDVISLAAITETKFELIPDLIDVSYDSSSLTASLKKIDGKIIRIEPDLCSNNDSKITSSYMTTIETSPTEEYTLFLSRECLLQCLNISDDSSNITEIMLSDLVEKQRLIFSNLRCIYDISSGIIKHVERQDSIQIIILQPDSLSFYEQNFFQLYGQNSPISPGIVSSFQEFYSNLIQRFQFDRIAPFIDFNEFNLAGGSVLISMLRNAPQPISSDLDFFYVGPTYDNFIQSFATVRQNLSNLYVVKQTILLKRRVYQLEIIFASTMAEVLGEPNKPNKIVLQFIYHPSISYIQSYLMAFDLDIVQVSYNGKEVLCAWSFIRALNTGTFICFNLTNDLSTLGRTVLRIAKYCQRNFRFLYPHDFQMERFLSLPVNQSNINQPNYDSISDVQFGSNNDFFQLQKKFVNIFINQNF